MKKVLSLVLSLLILASVMVTTPINAAITDITETGYSIPDEAGFAAKLNQLRAKYPNGGTWSGTYYEDGVAKAWQCFGYANQMLYEVFGAKFYNDGFYNKKDYNMGTIYAGDWVRIVTYGEPNNHSIFITKVTSDRVYFTDCNWNGKNGIRWDASYTKAELAQKFSYKVHIPGNTLTGAGGNNPQGCLDEVSSPSPGKLKVRGWAFDRDNLGASLAIHVYVGGPAGSGAPMYAITANKSRPDVNNAYPGVGNNHGFDDTITVSRTGSQAVYVYAINVGGGNTNPLLGSRTVNIQSDTTKPTISNITVSQVTSKGYRVSCKVSDNVGVAQVKFPTWTLKADSNGNNQDDLVWHIGSLEGNIATFYVKTNDHKNETGGYITDVYAYDSSNNYTVSRVAVTVTDEPKEISSVEYNGNTYKVFNSGKTWAEAKQWCEKQGGHLATITSENERIAVNRALEKFNGVPCWLGAESTSGTWKWVTGENFNYTNWSTGQPDCGSNAEFYLGTFNSTKKWLDCYLWNDYPSDGSSRIGGFVCEFEKKETPTETVTEKPTQPTTIKPTEPMETTQPTTETKATEPAETTAPTTETTEPATQATEAKPSEAPTVPAEGTFYVVAGCPELCNGAEWDPASPLNLMTLDDDGVYRITYSNVPAGTYVFKVTTNGAWDNGEFNLVGNAMYGGPNAEITVTEDNSTVVISLKESDMHANAYINGVLVDVGTTKPTEAPASTNPTSNPQSTKCNHSYKEITTKAPTYFAEGKGVVKCVKCHDFKGSVIFLKKLLKIPSVTISGDKKSIKIRYKKAVKDATGFVVKYSEKGKKKYFTKSFKTKEKTTKYIKNLKKNKKYTVSVRAYIKSGKKIAYSAWTKAKTVKVK